MVIGEQLVQQQILVATQTGTHRLSVAAQQQQQQSHHLSQQQIHHRRSNSSTIISIAGATSNVSPQGVLSGSNNNNITPNNNNSSLNTAVSSNSNNINLNSSSSNNNNNNNSNNSSSNNNNNNNNNNSNNNNSISNNNGPHNNSSSSNSIIGGLVGGGTSVQTAKNQLEQLNTMREALFSQDGWGCQHVNQDTNWEVPSSPEPTNKDPTGTPSIWKPAINNGTDLWESNLRNGGQPPTQAVQKTPWGHTPSSNLGGTWGEDDDGTDSSSVWTGNSSAGASGGVTGVGGNNVTTGTSANANGTPQWAQSASGVNVGISSASAASGTGNIGGVNSGGAASSSGVNVPGSSTANGSSGTANGNGWGDPRELRGAGPMVGGGPIDMRNVDPMRAASAGDPRDLRLLDPRDPIRGDPRGISGRLNGTSEMWGQHHPIAAQHQIPTMNKMVGPSGPTTVVSGGGSIGPGAMNAAAAVTVQWGASTPGQTVVGPKDLNSIGGSGKQVNVSGWEEPSPPPQRRNIPNYDDGTSVWSQQSRVPGGGSHWKDLPDSINRSHLLRNNNIGGQNGPSVVSGLGSNTPGTGLVGSGPTGGLGAAGIPNNPMGGVGTQNRLSGVGAPGVGVSVGQHKANVDNGMWVHQGSGNGTGSRNTGPSWSDDNNHNVGSSAGSSWVEDKGNAGLGQIGVNVSNAVNSWNDSTASWSKNQNKMTNNVSGWGATSTNISMNDGNDSNSDWTAAHSGIVVGKSQSKLGTVGGIGVGVATGVGNLNNELIKQSKQYRILIDTGFKKDDVERALISVNMNLEEAAELLRSNAATAIVMDSWRRHDEATLGSYDHSNSTVGAGVGFPGRYTATQPTMPFPPNNILNSMGATTVGANNPNLAALNSIQPLQVQKYLNQGPPHNVTAGGPQSVNAATVSAFGQANAANVTAAAVNAAAAASNSNNQPSTQQLRMLVQQIQLAVQSGYLSSQILNQPLAPPTLLLLNQLLTNIKHLQGAQQQLARGNNANNLQLNVTVAKFKQSIHNLQNQINAQQALYIKQQQQHQQQNLQQQLHPSSTHVNNSNNEYLRGHDAINTLQGNFNEMNLNKSCGYQTAPNQQSRLNQWKLPVLEKDITTDGTDFSRAPGTTKQNLSANNVNNMGPLGLQSDGTWSTGRNIGDGWPDTTTDENKDWSVAQTTSATAYTDLVQEFEPGKPWKGSQIKSIEDDPSITPGSVARSPLSINPTPKEADIFANAGKNSPTDLPPLSLSSSTWSFTPTNNQNFTSWSDNPQQCSASEIWATAMKKSRGPPPGLGSNKSGAVNLPVVSNTSTVASSGANSWLTGNRGVVVQNSSTPASWSTAGANSSWSSNWLLLKNITSQIDGSTLRTLCMQHGPLLTFHLYLNQGIALCKYATREEANKAQMTLNNCQLSNTTICAESPSENEVQNILQHLPQAAITQGAPGGVVAASGTIASNSNTNSTSNPNTNGNANVPSSVNGQNSVAGGGNAVVSNSVNVLNASTNNGGINNVTNCGNAQNQNQNTNTSTTTNSNSVCNNANNGSQNNSNNVAGPLSAAGNVGAQAVNWRQNQQQQQPQNQTRPSGREVDLDYTKYVNSIVDD